MGTVKSLGSSCGCVSVDTLMPCKFFVLICGFLVVVRYWVVAVMCVCVLILLMFCVGLVSSWLGREVVFHSVLG